MLPNNLTGKKIDIPKIGAKSIVILTGSNLRHDRFSYRLQQEFKENVLAWYQINDNHGKERLSFNNNLKKILKKFTEQKNKL